MNWAAASWKEAVVVMWYWWCLVLERVRMRVDDQRPERASWYSWG